VPVQENKTMSKIINYARDSYKELTEKVTWPTWPQLQQSTMIVLVATIVITLIVLAMDFVFGKGLTFIYDILN
jgi:preprotein translocase subunit SecE